MGGCRCSYKTCTNTTKTRENLHFFHYPVKQKDRCRQWIENANKPQFYDLDEDQLRNKVICETHFQDCYFPNVQKKRLLQGAVPTLDGDCEKEPASNSRLKIHDVQVLPANADGTIFVLETNNMQSNFQSERVESYIYTNNGLVLPINKCNEVVSGNIQSIYSSNDVEEVGETNKEASSSLNSSCENLNSALENVSYVFQPENNSVSEDFDMSVLDTQPPVRSEKATSTNSEEMRLENSLKISDDIIYKAVGNKYVKKIKQHSKDIAILKRILKSKSHYRKPTNGNIMHTLKRKVSSTLLSVINLQLNGNHKLSAEDEEFFSTIYSTSPEVYQILSDKYKWKMPNPDTLKCVKKNNGHLNCD